jgi:hypothetical protein
MIFLVVGRLSLVVREQQTGIPLPFLMLSQAATSLSQTSENGAVETACPYAAAAGDAASRVSTGV